MHTLKIIKSGAKAFLEESSASSSAAFFVRARDRNLSRSFHEISEAEAYWRFIEDGSAEAAARGADFA